MTPYVITLHREGIFEVFKKGFIANGNKILAQIKEIVVKLITELYGQGYTVCYTFIVYLDILPKRGTFYTMNKVLESGKSVINIYERMK